MTVGNGDVERTAVEGDYKEEILLDSCTEPP